MPNNEPAGPALDAAIAELMGLDAKLFDDGGCRACRARGYWPRFEPSTDISAAWEVVEWLRANGWNVLITLDSDDTGGECRFHRRKAPGIFVAKAPTAPLAICHAALAAKGADDDDSD